MSHNQNTRHRVVITGLGAITGFGCGWKTMWQKMLAGHSAIRSWQLPEFSHFPVRYAAPVDWEIFADRYKTESWWEKSQEKRARFGMAAGLEAITQANWSPSYKGRLGIAIGSGVPERVPQDMLLAFKDGTLSWENLYQQASHLNPHSGLQHGNDQLATHLAHYLGATGPVLNLSTACAGAAHAIGLGMRMIRRGEADAVLAGGADSVLNLPTMIGLHLLGAPSVCDKFGDQLCRPFDVKRSGFVAAEGAGMLLLESEEHARQRGAHIFAELAGFGSSLDAYRITAPHPEGFGAAYAMQRALQDANLAPDEVALINAHGTSTPLNDPAETQAIKQVFSKDQHYRKLMVTANKSMLGHLIAAAGAPELISTVLSVQNGIVPPTINLQHADPDCDLDYVPEKARYRPVKSALSNSFGFGGLNATLAVTRYEA